MNPPCWNCGAFFNALFCDSCRAIQRPPDNYYELFGLPRQLALDEQELERRFYALSRRLHPDLFTRRSEREKQFSTDATALLNDGYRVLRDPVRRAEYILKQAGFPVGEQGTRDVPPDLLEEVFELNLALEELKGGDHSVEPSLHQARVHFEKLLREIDRELAAAFREYDATGERDVLARIRAILNRRKYISNLVNEVNVALQRAA
jgi:Fe-S protein assembly co-chaperone HscB